MSILGRLKKLQTMHGKNRLVIVLDGMGVNIVNQLLSPDGFFHSHMTDIEMSVVPATTVAATTAYRTGKMPWETGFIGWAQYFAETDEVIEIFKNTNLYTEAPSKMPHHTNILPCKTIVEEMTDNGRVAFEVMPGFVPGGFDTFEQWLERIIELCNSHTDAYIYAYWSEPDSSLHELGVSDPSVKILLRDMEQQIELAMQKIHNATDVLITADHGHTEIESLYIDDYPELLDCLLHPLSLETRCVSIFVKSNCINQFSDLFIKHLGKWFKLVTKTEFETEYLHATKPVRFIGDFVALAIDKYDLKQRPDTLLLKSHHAGITSDELEIPIIKITI
mgnify:CR=1 FL=1